MKATIDPVSYRQCMSALNALPGRLRFKHERIALNAGAGVYRPIMKIMSPDMTGALDKSLGIKVKIPNASYNTKHHGKPSYALVGPKRDFVLPRIGGKTVSIRKAVKTVLGGGKVSVRKPSRYAHLAGPGRKQRFVNLAASVGAQPAGIKVIQKLKQGVEAEARRLASEQGVR
jgi:hypothetical protein